MRIVTKQQIESLISVPEVIDAVRQGFIAYARGQVELPPPMQILFKEDDGSFFGDCHVKAAQQHQFPYYAIKVASGFYKNPQRGLAANSGLVLVFSAQTGQPVALLQDEGWLTQLRTAAAGALAASLKPLNDHGCLGIVGAGCQALLQAQLICQTLDIKRVAIYSRNSESVARLCAQLDAELDGAEITRCRSVRQLCRQSDIVVTTTPATSAVITAEDIADNLHIVAVGADSPGKNEIAADITAKADLIVTDSHEQCLHHGDFGVAVRAGVVAENSDISFGRLLAGEHTEADFAAANLSMVDLTGIGAQDLAIASLVIAKLQSLDTQ